MELYWYDSHKIELTTNGKWHADHIQMNAAHGLGHYLYDETYSLWQRRRRSSYPPSTLIGNSMLWNAQAKWRHSLICMPCTGGNSQYISQECWNMIEEAEGQCIWVYNRNTGGKWQEREPGVEPLDGIEGVSIEVAKEASGTEELGAVAEAG